MNIYLNGDLITADEAITLHDLMTAKGINDKKGVAVALNNSVVSRNNWLQTLLKANDKILVISATKGG